MVRLVTSLEAKCGRPSLAQPSLSRGVQTTAVRRSLTELYINTWQSLSRDSTLLVYVTSQTTLAHDHHAPSTHKHVTMSTRRPPSNIPHNTPPPPIPRNRRLLLFSLALSPFVGYTVLKGRQNNMEQDRKFEEEEGRRRFIEMQSLQQKDEKDLSVDVKRTGGGV